MKLVRSTGKKLIRRTAFWKGLGEIRVSFVQILITDTEGGGEGERERGVGRKGVGVKLRR